MDGLVSVVRPGDPPSFARRRGLKRVTAWLSMLLVDHGIFRTFFNTRRRVDAALWRSSQPMPYQLRKAARDGIKTVINLRGPADNPYYLLEEEAAQAHGLTLVNFALYSREVPKRESVKAAAKLFETIEYPALIHCKSGADRAGVMAALYLILKRGRSASEALEQLSMRYGHFRQAKTGLLDAFVEAYRDGGERRGQTMLQWLDDGYDREAIARGFHSQSWARVLVDFILRRE